MSIFASENFYKKYRGYILIGEIEWDFYQKHCRMQQSR